MVQSYSPNSRSISLLATQDFLEHDSSSGPIEKVLPGDVTVSAIPDGSGATHWEARTAAGQALRVFRMTIDSAVAAGPVVVDALEGIYVCYEDEARQQTWCVQVGSH